MVHYKDFSGRARLVMKKVERGLARQKRRTARSKLAQKKAEKATREANKRVVEVSKKHETAKQDVSDAKQEVAGLEMVAQSQKERWELLESYVGGIGLDVPTWPYDPFDPLDPNNPDDPNRPEPKRGDCIDFEDVPAGKVYPHGSVFMSEGVKFEVVPESDPKVKLPADPATSGTVRVMSSPGPGLKNCPQDFGQYLNHDNALLKLDIHQFPQYANGVRSVCFKYCETGGSVYLRVNGKSWNFSTMMEDTPGTAARDLRNYHGLTLGGVRVTVTKFLFGATSSSGAVINDHFGMVWLHADGDLIHSYEVGGQELFTDYHCIPCHEKPPIGTPNDPPTTGAKVSDCVEFEDLVAGDKYPQGAGLASQFTSNELLFEVIAESDPAVALPAAGLPTSSGTVIVQPSPGVGVRNCPNSFGQYIMHHNCVVKLDVTQIPEWSYGAYTACVNYCNLGGHSYLRINGQAWDFAAHMEASPGTSAPELMSYNGLIMGGVKATVTKFGIFGHHGGIVGCFGKIYLETDKGHAAPRIFTIEIGGQELFTDKWCVPCDEYPPLGQPGGGSIIWPPGDENYSGGVYTVTP